MSVMGGDDARMVLTHVDDDLTMLLPFPFSAVGLDVDVFAGCDHTTTDCDTKFFTTEFPSSNIPNYGGFPFVPLRNIFDKGLKL